MNAIRIHFIVLLSMGWGCCVAQSIDVFLDGKKADSWNYSDSTELRSRIERYKMSFWNAGHLFAGLDSLNEKGLYFHVGKKYEISASKSYENLLRNARKEFEETINSGFPFAQLRWGSLDVDPGKFEASYEIINGPFIEFDSIVFLSPVKTKKWFLEQSLGIEKRKPFSERTYRSISRKLDRISFMEEISKPDLSFQEGKAHTYLNLKEASTGSFQGVLGVLPNQSSDGRPLVTGSLDLSLHNLFRSGKQLDFAWDRFGEFSQKLDVRYEHPYFLKSSLSIESDLNILKQDSSFISTTFGLNAGWFISDKSELGVSFEQSANDVLLEDASRIVSLGLLGFEQKWYGLEFSTGKASTGTMENLFHANVGLEIGTRSIRENAGLPTDYYDSIRLESSLGRISGYLEIQKTLSKQFAIFNSLSGKHLQGGQLPLNQLFRIGGLKTLRGFNEQFFFAESYLISQTEFRIFFEERSYLFAFVDQGWVRSAITDYPVGMGIGFSLDTTSGLFSFAMAVGSNRDLPLDLAAAKIHFGYLSRF